MGAAEKNTAAVRAAARRWGFDFCGLAAARPLDEDARRLEAWLSAGRHGGMSWMENHFELRVDPTKLVPGARSVITLLKNYYPSERGGEGPKVSKYAWGEDYHTVIRTALNGMLDELRGEVGDIAGRGFVDSAPVLERSWAVQSGLGWVGKNGNLIHPKAGSFFFIATLITDLPLLADSAMSRDYCGSCSRCVDACPTGAILPNKEIDGSRCISYYTIELKEALIPDTQRGKFDGWMFGCDTCQDVCPWNRFSKPHNEPAFEPLPGLLNLTSGAWEEMSEAAFRDIFRKSPLNRAKWSGIQRNLKFLKT